MVVALMMAPATGSTYFYQWDLNQQLSVTGDVTEIHFAQPNGATALVMPVENGLATIPNILLQNSGTLTAYAYTPDRTLTTRSWKIIARQKAEDYVYTETEVKTWGTIEAEAANAIAIAQGVRDDAAAGNFDGEDGGYYTPDVSESGALSWTASKDGMPAVDIANVKGPQGPQGETGAAGDTPVRGTDYWTDNDKQEIVTDVLATTMDEEPTEDSNNFVKSGGTFNAIKTIKDVIYSAQATPNLYDANNSVDANIAPNISTLQFVSTTGVSLVLPILPNKTVTIQKVSSERCTLALSTDYPAVGVTVNSYAIKGAITSYTFETGADDHYLAVLYYLDGTDTLTKEEIAASIKIFYGSTWVEEDQTKFDDITKAPLSNLDSGLLNLLSNRTLGPLSKGYLCLTCDDGTSALATYTIPKLKDYATMYGKNIPVTFGLMDSSAVLNDDTYKTLVQDMITAYGCQVATHGINSLTGYTEKELNEYLYNQETALATLCGSAPKSVIYPNHDYNNLVAAVCGGRYGVCFTGGTYAPVKYNYYCSGPRSNLYTLFRMSLLNTSMTNAAIQAQIDYAIANNMILIPFWHDIDFTRDDEGGFTAAQKQALLDYCVSYAVSSGITFITAGDIPNLL